MKAILRIGFLAFAIMAQAVPADAGPLEDGKAAYEREDYATALKFWHPLAERGDAEAQTNLGSMYHFGKGVPQDYAEAVKWYRLAAEQGSAWARVNLGDMYREGQGVPQDYVLAHMWYNLAAATDDPTWGATGRELRDLYAEIMTPDQIAEAQRLAREWMAKRQQ